MCEWWLKWCGHRQGQAPPFIVGGPFFCRVLRQTGRWRQLGRVFCSIRQPTAEVGSITTMPIVGCCSRLLLAGRLSVRVRRQPQKRQLPDRLGSGEATTNNGVAVPKAGWKGVETRAHDDALGLIMWSKAEESVEKWCCLKGEEGEGKEALDDGHTAAAEWKQKRWEQQFCRLAAAFS
jgi:hypothetical protein